MITHDPTDVLVVGAGLSGSLVAAGLAAQGRSVVVLEAGPPTTAATLDGDEVGHVVDRRLLHAEPEVLALAGGPPQVGPWLARNRGVGGPLAWSGFAYRFHPSDFRAASESGVPAGSSLADWPIGYDDVAPWYERAEGLLGVGGTAGENPYEAPRAAPYAEPAVERSEGSDRLARAATSLGWHPYHPPAAVLTRPHAADGRGACIRCGLCTYYGCPSGAKASVGVTAAAHGLRAADVRAGCTAVEVRCDASGRPVAVRYVDPAGVAAEQPATTIVLALNAPYAARLLLLSRSDTHPDGIGNAADQVGRHLTFHTGSLAYGVYDDVLRADRNPAQQVGIDDHNEGRPSAAGVGFRRGGVLHGGISAAFTGGPLAFAAGLDRSIPLPEGVPRYGDGLLRFAAHAYPRHQAVFILGEDLPQPGNRVTLDPVVRDSLGLPALRMTYDPHPEDVAQQRYLVDRALDLLRSSGAGVMAGEPSVVPGGMFAGHAHGTTRMGDDPATSVTDDAGLVHGTDNLFVVGAGGFVTAAGLNPALTIAALALRSVDRIAATV